MASFHGLGMVFPSLEFTLKHSKPHATWSSPPLFPAAGWRGKFEAKIGGKVHRLRYEQYFENNSEIRQWAAMILRTVYRKRGVWFTHDCLHPAIPNHSLCHIAYTQKGASPPRKWSEVIQNNLWVLPCPILAPAKINAVLARTRALTITTKKSNFAHLVVLFCYACHAWVLANSSLKK